MSYCCCSLLFSFKVCFELLCTLQRLEIKIYSIYSKWLVVICHFQLWHMSFFVICLFLYVVVASISVLFFSLILVMYNFACFLDVTWWYVPLLKRLRVKWTFNVCLLICQQEEIWTDASRINEHHAALIHTLKQGFDMLFRFPYSVPVLHWWCSCVIVHQRAGAALGCRNISTETVNFKQAQRAE